MPDTQAPRLHATTSPLSRYLQSVDGVSSHNADGLRTYKGRQFADIANNDGSAAGTVMVTFHDLIKAYRAKLPSEREPSGPPLYRVPGTNVWRLTKPVEYYPSSRYTLEEFATYFSAYVAPVPNAQGYYPVHEWVHVPGGERMISNRYVGFAFKDKDGKLVKVDPSEARGDPSLPLKLAHWTDAEIWDVYRLHGAEVVAFRAEAQASGRAPDWATRAKNQDHHEFLLDSMRWSHPHKSRSECAELLRTYNLSVAQQQRLRADMENGFPEWAEQHKRLTHNTLDERRFEHIAQELGPFCLRLRQEGERYSGYDLPPVKQRYEESFLNSYLEHAGYKRNKHDFLYRTDIPAMFRADLRTPFELARDERLVTLAGNHDESTTKSSFSTTFSAYNALSYTGFDYYSNPRHYNTQANRYPGHVSDDEPSMANAYSSGNESDTSFEMDNSRDYPLLRRNQRHSFIYVIDTRGVEVVPRVENLFLNNRDFDGDVMEGRISTPKRGISAERIWLLNSDMTMAANVEDIFLQAGGDVDVIEEATWAGGNQSRAYDRLINQVAFSGGVVLHLPKGNHTYSNDVSWPVPEHYRT
ncbi:MAG TPA: hypothetical protein VNV36_14605 [Pseudomonas sp.]|uniref:hypothetical protein n=1 Tax=Pseudomonas sp. TaxID=306 RepID=UPI002B8903A6|nr:hypothetical protein [Pseudomonas sp.]HWH87990.1 hypothetical protein [Pseudomonas sp.]